MKQICFIMPTTPWMIQHHPAHSIHFTTIAIYRSVIA